jgi:hypothetical protein
MFICANAPLGNIFWVKWRMTEMSSAIFIKPAVTKKRKSDNQPDKNKGDVNPVDKMN